jgi:hypothetical protein
MSKVSHLNECKEKIQSKLNARLQKMSNSKNKSVSKFNLNGQFNQSSVVLPRIIYSLNYSGEKEKKIAIFLHGKLAGNGVERPAFHCAPIIHEIVTLSGLPIVMPEFHTLIPLIQDEPLNLDIGIISKSIFETTLECTADKGKVPFVAYSFGCFILAKFLRTELAKKINPIVLIAPVIPKEVMKSWREMLTESPSLIIWGTHDRFVKDPESLTLWFPNATLYPINGGNHLYYLMSSPMDRYDECPASISRIMQRKIAAWQVKNFIEKERLELDYNRFDMIEESADSKKNLTNQFYKKCLIAETIYARFDNSNMEYLKDNYEK